VFDLNDGNRWQRQEADIDILRDLFGDVLGEVIFGLAAAVLSAGFVEAISDDGQSNRVLAGIGHLTMGLVAGALSLFVLQHPVVRNVSIPGASLVFGPIGTGAVFEVLGRWWVRRGNVRMALFTFRGGACFALGMALLRFTYFRWF
jgi:hypothetical protein